MPKEPLIPSPLQLCFAYHIFFDKLKIPGRVLLLLITYILLLKFTHPAIGIFIIGLLWASRLVYDFNERFKK